MVSSHEDAPLLGRNPERSETDDGFVFPSHESDDESRRQLNGPETPLERYLDPTPATAAKFSITRTERATLFFGIFLVGYVYGLESQVRSTYQPYATSSFSLHSRLATINVLRSVMGIAAQPTVAKVADVFGRFKVIAVSILLYSVGIAIEASAGNVELFCAGAVLYQVGYTCSVLLTEVLIADYSSMRARVLFSYIPALPFVINTWISGNITSAVLRTTTWRWGFGMWAIIYPIASLPLLVTLYFIERRANRSTLQSSRSSSLQRPASQTSSSKLLLQLDIVGLALIVAALCLILAPLTIAGGKASHWGNPQIIVPLVVGVVLVPTFIVWEKRGARKPLVPYHLLTDRGVWAALSVRCLLNFAWSTQANYLFTVLIVAFDFPVETATRILSFFSFFGVVSGVIMSLVIYRIRRLKYIIVTGTIIFMIAFGLLVQYPGGADASSRSGLLGAQVLLGLSGGLFAYPTQASIQASAMADHVAILTGLYHSFFNIGAALGSCMSGLIWTQTLYPVLESNLSFQPNASLAGAIYDSPFAIVPHYPVGSAIREAIIESYQYVQRILCIAGMSLCVPMIGFALLLRNPKLSEEHIQPEAGEAHTD
ncbi:major facilitator superfamily transporter [Xylariaceae sp. FL0662B]|nr:major facilitator superfamily transporter [Xylariaceae sp. FL0662B]